MVDLIEAEMIHHLLIQNRDISISSLMIPALTSPFTVHKQCMWLLTVHTEHYELSFNLTNSSKVDIVGVKIVFVINYNVQ